MFNIIKIIILALLLKCSAFAADTNLVKYKVVPHKKNDFITLKFNSSNVNYQYFMLSSPDRLVVDLPRIKFTLPKNNQKITANFVTTINFGTPNAYTLRMVIHLKHATNNIIVTRKADKKQQQTYLTIKLLPQKKSLLSTVETPSTTPVQTPHKASLQGNTEKTPSIASLQSNTAATGTTDHVVREATPIAMNTEAKKTTPINHKKHQKKPPIVASKVPEKSVRNVVVIIDAGHGGKDPGAVSRHGIKEKDVIIAVAKKVYKILEQEPGITPKLTRMGDYYVLLRDRLKLARKGKADLFVSIHADAYKRLAANGATVFALSARGATSEAAHWLAQKENYSELSGINLANKSDLLRSVLLNLSQTGTIRESLELGNDILSSFRGHISLHSYKVEQAQFVVLKSPDIPSLLIEIGFLTNAEEERRLVDPDYQTKIAEGIARGIIGYFRAHPPRGSYFAPKTNDLIYHKVEAGEDLEEIAKRYNLTTRAIIELNNLRSTKLREGQIIKIPAWDVLSLNKKNTASKVAKK